LTELLLVAAIGAGALTAVSIALVAVLSLRALRRGVELEAEMKALSFGFRLHLQPQGQLHDDGGKSREGGRDRR
jgi:hypothetical protein